jgi:hypothetical protein
VVERMIAPLRLRISIRLLLILSFGIEYKRLKGLIIILIPQIETLMGTYF